MNIFVETVVITGLRENFGRDGGIEEPYWEPSVYTDLTALGLFYTLNLFPV